MYKYLLFLLALLICLIAIYNINIILPINYDSLQDSNIDSSEESNLHLKDLPVQNNRTLRPIKENFQTTPQLVIAESNFKDTDVLLQEAKGYQNQANVIAANMPQQIERDARQLNRAYAQIDLSSISGVRGTSNELIKDIKEDIDLLEEEAGLSKLKSS